MSDTKNLLIVAHNPSSNTQKLVAATLRGATHEDIEGIEVKHIPPLQAVAEQMYSGPTPSFSAPPKILAT